MKKQILLITSLVFIASVASGGGIVTNSNQSAYWVRTLVRDAAIGPDAVYFNPAGLTKMEDGFHFSYSSQTIFQNKDVSNDYVNLIPTPKKYYGDVLAPVFPSLYATWKKNKIAISFGFNPIGGGGGATFEDGLPSFEQSMSDVRAGLQPYGASNYRRDVYFKGTSVFFGYQLGITYQISDKVSVYAGARYVSAKNTYEGYLRNVEVQMGENWVEVSDAFTNLAVQAALGEGAANSISSSMDAMIGAGLPSTFTLAQAEGAGALTSAQRAQIEGGLDALGIDKTLQLAQIQAVATATATAMGQASDEATAKAELTGVLFNQEADVVQKGSGITPIIGINLALSDKFNVGLKYEFMTKIELENDTKNDFIVGLNGATPITMFPDGAKIRNDMPAMLSLGAEYKLSPKFSATAGFHYYWDKNANYGKTLNGELVSNEKVIDNNYYELGLGLEYGITEKLFGSLGYLFANTGVSKEYQSDLSYSLTSNSVGGGLGYKISDHFMVNAGALYSFYNQDTKTYPHLNMATEQEVNTTDTYFKDTLILSIGLDFSF